MSCFGVSNHLHHRETRGFSRPPDASAPARLPRPASSDLVEYCLCAESAEHRGILATLDRGIRTLARRSPNNLELILGEAVIA
jgi:hypothetical protein